VDGEGLVLAIGAYTEFHTLIHGWLVFEFRSGADLERILAQRWFLGHSLLDLRRWRQGFDPQKETMFVEPM
jgi:hypothetical protein